MLVFKHYWKNKWVRWSAGLVVGAVLGYVYYLELGCKSGTCAITSDPVHSAIYGGLMGALLFDGWSSKKEGKSEG